jgi:3-oxoacyl-[acyl-carrier protein] reductase
MPVSSKSELVGRVAVITGAARGIGQAVALAFARDGAYVVAADVLDLDDTVKQVEALGQRCVGVPTDTTDKAAVGRMVSTAVETFGGLDVLVTCAGVYGGGALDIDDDEWDRVYQVNVKGTYLPIQAAFPALVERGGGKIVCLGSIAGKVGGVLAGPHYVASKGAVHAMVRWLAKYGAPHGIYANGVAPGAVDTEMIRGQGYKDDYCLLGRLADPADIAEAVVYLASPASNYVTGKVLSVDGGYTVMD